MKNSVRILLIVIIMASVSCKQKEVPVTDLTMVNRSIEDPLPSWNEGENKRAIISFLENVTKADSPDFIPIQDRVATFDNDGTLWSEQPMYFQFFFALERVKALAPEHPEWKKKQPFKAVLENDLPALFQQGEKGIMEIVMATHAGNTTEEFEKLVKDWMATAVHPEKKKHFNELVFQPMLELMIFLRANEFKTYVVSGGGIEFMRPWTEDVYGIPRNQVAGSSIETVYDYNDGKPILKRLAKIDLIDDKEGKPVGINRYIGRKPVFAAGNSDGDLDMLRWTDSNKYKTFKLFVHHTDSVREWAYDRNSPIGKFDKGWDEAVQKNWTIIDMQKDWKRIYPFDK